MRTACLLLLLSGAAFAAGPADGIRLPEPTAVPQPMPPAPAPGSAVRLDADALYVVEADREFLLFASPKHLVKVTRETGPIRIRAKFAGGTGTLETREFKGPHVAILEAAGTGAVEVIVVPAGAKTETDAIRRQVDVFAGDGPRPPPKPDVDPKPEPKPEPKVEPGPIPADGLHVLIVYDTAKNLSAEQNSILYGKEVRDYLQTSCVTGPDGKTRQYRIWGSNTDAAGDSALWDVAMKRKRDSLPWVVVSNGAKGGYEGPLPTDSKAFLELVKKYQ